MLIGSFLLNTQLSPPGAFRPPPPRVCGRLLRIIEVDSYAEGICSVPRGTAKGV